MVAGREQGGAGDEVGEGVEFVGRGVEGGNGGPVGLVVLPAFGVGRGGLRGEVAAANVLADDAAADPAGAVVVALVATGFPGHAGPAPEAEQNRGALHKVSMPPARARAHAD